MNEFNNTEALLHDVASILDLDPVQAGCDERFLALRNLVRDMAAQGYRRPDPSRDMLVRLGEKWSPLLLLLLDAGSFRHATLKRLAGAIGADKRISQRILTMHLRTLERDGFVSRTITPSVPPRVDYALTALGKELVVQIKGFMAWAGAHGGEIQRARTRFDATCGDR